MAIDILRLVLGLGFLIYGALQDIRTRRAKNPIWLAMGSLGLLFLTLEMVLDGRDAQYYLVLPLLVCLFAYAFIEFTEGKKTDWQKGVIPWPVYSAALAFSAALALLAGVQLEFSLFYYKLAGTAIFLAIIYLLYMLRLLTGGGDARAMLAITLMMPFYPGFMDFPFLLPGDPHSRVILYPLSVLFTAQLFMVLILPFFFLVKNLLARNLDVPWLFLGYKLRLDELEGKQVFLMEKMKDGGVKRYHFPPRGIDFVKLRDVFLEMLETALEGPEGSREKAVARLGELSTLGDVSEEKLREMRLDFREFDPKSEESLALTERKYFSKDGLYHPLRALVFSHDIDLLRKAGKEEVWVSSKFPFLVPLCISYGVSFFCGSLLFWIVEVI